ncbi:hypothetical protein AB6813_15975, partial [bacterium RCC_150]
AKNSTNQKTIGINKLGTLLSSQTTDTFEYFSKQIQSSVFLRRDVYTVFHSNSLCKSGFFSRYSPSELNIPNCSINSPLSRTLVRSGSFTINGVRSQFFRISGGDSENNTRSPRAAQVGPEGACRSRETA